MTINYYFGKEEELYEFEPEFKDVIDKIIEFFAVEYNIRFNIAEEIIFNYNLENKCFDMYYYNLKEIYEKEAYQNWQSENNKKNPTNDFVNLLNNEMEELKNFVKQGKL